MVSHQITIEEILKQVRLPFKGSPRDYQIEDILEAIKVPCYGHYLDLGLGKTFVSIMTAVGKIIIDKVDKAVVLCPASLITQWMKVLKIMGLETLSYSGTPGERKKLKFDNFDFVVMSYQIYQTDYERIVTMLDGIKVQYIVDEATILCNVDNKLYLMLMGGSTKDKRKKKEKVKYEIVNGVPVPKEPSEVVTYKRQMYDCDLLTATPINRPTDAYGLISITFPEAYSSYSNFERRHVLAKNKYNVGTEFYDELLIRENLLLNGVLRRKEDHIELPPIIYNTICYELTPKHKKLYDKLIDEKMLTLPDGQLIDAANASSLRHWAQKLVINPEIGGLTEDPMCLVLMDDLLPLQSKFLIFANYIASNKAIMKRYNIGGSFGAVSKAKKEQYKEDFKHGDLRGLAMHYRSGGYGLDLPEAKFVNFVELPATPRDFRQCVARSHRQGQDSTVTVNVCYAKYTIQETIMKRLFEVDEMSGEVLDTPIMLEDVLMANPESARPRTKEEIVAEMKGIILDNQKSNSYI